MSNCATKFIIIYNHEKDIIFIQDIMNQGGTTYKMEAEV